MSETAPFTMPGASASPPTSVDAALVAAAAAQAAPAASPAPAPPVAAVPLPTEPLPLTQPALASLVAQVTRHVHAAPAARAASVLASIKTALDGAVAIHTNAVAAATTAAKSPSEISILVADAQADLSKIETSAAADLKGLTGIVVPKWAIGLAMLLLGGAVGAALVRFVL